VADDAHAAAPPPAVVDTTVSHSARIWNYWLGGKDNNAADREAGDKVAAMLPSIVAQARADRAFLGRAIRYLAGAEGIRQFLDIGTGCRPPTTPTMWPSGQHRRHGSSTPTTTRWCWPTPARC
jgi:S-adenosyl methyltransferase